MQSCLVIVHAIFEYSLISVIVLPLNIARDRRRFTSGLRLQATVDGKVIECQMAPVPGVLVDNPQKHRPAL